MGRPRGLDLDGAGHQAIDPAESGSNRHYEYQQLDTGEQPSVLLLPGPEIKHRTGQAEHCHQQNIFEPGSHEHEQGVDNGLFAFKGVEKI